MITTLNKFKETYTPGEGHKIADKVKQQDVTMLVTEWPESKIQNVYVEVLTQDGSKFTGRYDKIKAKKYLQEYFKKQIESGKYSEIKKYFTNPKSNLINEDSNVFDINSLSSLQFIKLIDLLEADINMYDYSDMNYYEQETGIDIGTLIDLYNGYGYNFFKYDKTKLLINTYCKLHNKTYIEIKNEAEEIN